MKSLSNETKEIKEASRFTTKFTAERWVHISLGRAVLAGLGIFAAAFISGIAGSAFIRFNASFSLPGRVDAIEKEMTNFMPLDLSTEKWKNNDKSHDDIEKKLDNIEVKIDIIRNLIK